MQVSIKDKTNTTFTTISNSKLLAVPYAFFAATAGELSKAQTLLGAANGNTPGVPSQNWSLFGNSRSDATKDVLGTSDYVDLVIVTNYLERMRILANGDIIMKRSLSIGANLNVDSSASFNTKAGSTVNNGPFTVGTPLRRSPTFLYGSLTVDQNQPTLLGGTLTVDKATDLNTSLNVDGPTDLNSRLNVNMKSPTTLTGILHVKGITDLDSALNVNGGNPTVLTGKLRVDSNAVFKSTTNSDTLLGSPNGALAIFGGVGIAKNLTIGGDVRIGGHSTFNGPLNVSDGTESFDPYTGAIIVKGGVGIGKRLNVKGATRLYDNLNVDGLASMDNTTESTNTTTGALVVKGGEGIAKNLNVGGATTIGGALTAAGLTTINNKLVVNAATDYVAEFKNTTDANGISIQIATAQSNNNNHFITFKDNAGTTVGRIQGETLSELHGDLDYQLDLTGKIYDVTSGAIDVSLATVNLAETIAFQIEADASVNVCAGLGVVACPPIASFVAGSIAEVVIASIEEALVIAEVVVASTDLGLWVANKEASIGVTYQSGAGDYAEFLMKQQPDEKIFPGDIVGVRGGKVSKNIEGAEKVMVVSHKPIVLGNTPAEAAEKNFEKVAFMGQVPVKVF